MKMLLNPIWQDDGDALNEIAKKTATSAIDGFSECRAKRMGGFLCFVDKDNALLLQFLSLFENKKYRYDCCKKKTKKNSCMPTWYVHVMQPYFQSPTSLSSTFVR